MVTHIIYHQTRTYILLLLLSHIPLFSENVVTIKFPTGLALAACLFAVAVKLYVSREILERVIPPSSEEIHVTSIITLFAVLAKPYNMHIYLSHRVKHAERLPELYLNVSCSITYLADSVIQKNSK